MSDFLETYRIFKESDFRDIDMQNAFRRKITVGKVINILQENEKNAEHIAELEQDLNFMLEQSVVIEHKQDHEKMYKLRKKYGLE
jgi:DNA-binding transcriptional MerR regulator